MNQKSTEFDTKTYLENSTPQQSPGKQKEEVVDIPVGKIRRNPRNPRTVFVDSEIKELAESIQQNGLVQPVTVRRIEDPESDCSFELIAGEKRWLAHKHLKSPTIRAIIRSMSDQESQTCALIENVQRGDMTFWDIMNGYFSLKEFYETAAGVARKVGKKERIVQQYFKIHTEIHSFKVLHEADPTVPDVAGIFESQKNSLDLATGDSFAQSAPEIRKLCKSNKREFDRIMKWMKEGIKLNMTKILNKCGRKNEKQPGQLKPSIPEYLVETPTDYVLNIKISKKTPVPEEVMAQIRESIDKFIQTISIKTQEEITND